MTARAMTYLNSAVDTLSIEHFACPVIGIR